MLKATYTAESLSHHPNPSLFLSLSPSLSLYISISLHNSLRNFLPLSPVLGNMEEAERLLGKALRAFPESTRVRLSYAELFELRVRAFELNSYHPTSSAYSAQKA
jgi:hypothetical protein